MLTINSIKWAISPFHPWYLDLGSADSIEVSTFGGDQPCFLGKGVCMIYIYILHYTYTHTHLYNQNLEIILVNSDLCCVLSPELGWRSQLTSLFQADLSSGTSGKTDAFWTRNSNCHICCWWLLVVVGDCWWRLVVVGSTNLSWLRK
jgi:hypothetical protein